MSDHSTCTGGSGGFDGRELVHYITFAAGRDSRTAS